MESTIAWMIAGGARLDERVPDPDLLAHLVAIRDAKREASRASSPFTRLVAWFGLAPTRATISPATCACPA